MPDASGYRDDLIHRFTSRSFTLAEFYYVLEASILSLSSSIEMDDEMVDVFNGIKIILSSAPGDMNQSEFYSIVDSIVALAEGKGEDIMTVVDVLVMFSVSVLYTMSVICSDEMVKAREEDPELWKKTLNEWVARTLVVMDRKDAAEGKIPVHPAGSGTLH